MSGQGGFTVPFSSSPPSTPGSRRQTSDSHENLYGDFATNPSTTPAGPPPSSARSFTPAGPPPLSVFGSSQLGPGTTIFPTKDINGSHIRSGPKADRSVFNISQPRNGTATHFASSSLPEQNDQPRDGTDDEYHESEGSEEGHVSEDGSMDVDSQEESDLLDGPSTRNLRTREFQSSAAYDWVQQSTSVKDISPRSSKRSQISGLVSHRSSHRGDMHLGRKESAIPAVAKSLAKQIGPPPLDEPVRLIVETEKLVMQLYPQDTATQDQEQALESALHVIPEALCKLWQSCCNQNKLETERTIVIGPSEDEPAIHKATFLGSLLLKLHHPRPAKGKQAYIASQARLVPRPSNSFQADGMHARLEPYPKVLLDWLEQHHNPYRTAIMELRSFYPNPTANINFWDIVFSAVLRGKLSDVVRILENSDFKYARTAREDGQVVDGYHGIQLGTITRVMNQAIQVLESCPAVQDEDWNVTGNDWMIFRKRVDQAMSDLAAFAEGHDRDLEPAESTFQAENFGLRSSSTALSRSARRAQSKVPWTIYQNLKAMYGLLLGGTTEIVAFAQDWVEATIGLAVWWNGDEDEEIAVGSLAMTRRSLRRSQKSHARSVDLSPGAAYQQRLAYSFARVTDESEDETFQIDSLNAVEVGLASVFEGNIEGILDLLLAWSTPIAAAVVEIATQAGWFESLPGDGVVDGFNESDLMVLSYGQPKKGLTRDGILVDYAQKLFARDLREPKRQESEFGSDVEGWELSIEILDRLDDTSLANKKVVELLGRLPLNSNKRTDKIIEIFRALGLEGEACGIAERYANSIVEESDKYGTALLYYAYSHNAKKVKDVLDLLISLSVVQSIAFPFKANLDPTLSNLVNNPREFLALIVEQDPKAAELLQFYLGGYATLRKFYDLRDEEIHLQAGDKPILRPIARKKEAATALLMVIASAADNIQGGLYDEERHAVVPLDALLALLGEATVFVNQPTRILSLPQLLSILSAIEDLQTIHRRIYAQCQECFQSTIAAAQGSQRPPSPREMMKKSISSLTSSSGFSLVGSSMLNDDRHGVVSDGGHGLTNGHGKPASDAQQRGWDWRIGMREGAKGEDLLRMLRLNLAREVARAWVEG